MRQANCFESFDRMFDRKTSLTVWGKILGG